MAILVEKSEGVKKLSKSVSGYFKTKYKKYKKNQAAVKLEGDMASMARPLNIITFLKIKYVYKHNILSSQEKSKNRKISYHYVYNGRMKFV